MGHMATADRVWARMKWKPDPTAKDVAAGDAGAPHLGRGVDEVPLQRQLRGLGDLADPLAVGLAHQPDV